MSDFTPPPPPPAAGSGGGGGLIYPTTPPKDPVVVLLLNLFLAGFGSIIIGQKTKGIIAIVAAIVGIPVTCGILTCAILGFQAIDGYLQAQQLQKGHPVGEWTFFNDHK